MASATAQKLNELKLELNGKQVAFLASSRAAELVTLYLGNLPDELSGDEALLKDAVEKFGSTERCFIARSPDGTSKGYGIVEMSLPSSATKLFDEMEEISREMRKGIQYREAVALRAKVTGVDMTPTKAAAKEDEEKTPSKAETSTAEEPKKAEETPDSKAKEDSKDGDEKEAVDVAMDGAEEHKEEGTEEGGAEEAKKEEEEKAEGGAASSDAKKEDGDNAASKPAGPVIVPVPSPTVSIVGGKRPFVKPLRAEWNRSCSPASFFSKHLYVANLSPVRPLVSPPSPSLSLSLSLPLSLSLSLSLSTPPPPLSLSPSLSPSPSLPLSFFLSFLPSFFFHADAGSFDLVLQGFQNEMVLRKEFAVYGPVRECHLAKNKATGYAKGFAFIEFIHSASATAAFKDLDDKMTPMGKLAVAFLNPSKVRPLIASRERERERERERAEVAPVLSMLLLLITLETLLFGSFGSLCLDHPDLSALSVVWQPRLSPPS